MKATSVMPPLLVASFALLLSLSMWSNFNTRGWAETGASYHLLEPAIIQQRGQQLRAALDLTYKQIIENRALARPRCTSPALCFDLSGIVRYYIQSGMPFSDAEAILQAAGFKVQPHPKIQGALDNPNRPSDWYAVVARISPFAYQSLARYDIFIELYPSVPGDYTTVETIAAALYVGI